MATNDCERLTTRMSTETKELLEKALVLSGHSNLNSFITSAAALSAKKLIEQEANIHLSQDEAVDFLTALDRPRTANAHFLKAARRHKETITNADYATR
ncbi:DUF1778 domain-containing protein [Neiella sp. HB171785]|uniref:DUF1778 domain-containing protein n=1 Tax=Neiella litorisoli TaxID=2771431 RepID=A0A8J6QIM2_9GAMM|nr:DUF1778 domain-containing protein [Neiella litorisoli]MBD1389378.1 DUF1778 domain-containing protein [Neiella litorisoli]